MFVGQTVPQARADDARTWQGITWWSVTTVLLAIPVWAMALRSAVLSRDIDGGIFLSVSGGIANGLDLYTGVWDNKDPLFFVLMTLAGGVNDALPFVMDWLWIPMTAFGAWLIARAVMPADRALVVALVATPLTVLGLWYIPGFTNTPGTALTLLAWGLLARRWGIAAGVVAGLLVFTKLVLAPVAVLGLALAVLSAHWRRAATRSLLAFAATVLFGLGALAAAGWLSGWFDAIARNRDYSVAITEYFGAPDGVFGRLGWMTADWQASDWSVVGVIGVALVVGGIVAVRRRNIAQTIAVAWLAIAAAGTAGILGLTFSWSHHAQALALPAVLAVVVLVGALPAGTPYLISLVLVGVVTLVAGAWGSPRALIEQWDASQAWFSDRTAEIDEVPLDAFLLNSVSEPTFTYARLGTNDDRGFLRDVRTGAELVCPQFHLYDFSPVSAFDEQFACIQGVDVIVRTDNFDVFANGGRAASVQPILDYVDANFTCMRVDDRQLCTRTAG